jgi:hypothetical protein
MDYNLNVVLLHEGMVDKTGKAVTTSLTLIDVHDIARSSKTYGLRNFYVAHPSSTLRKLSNALEKHWEEGFGATYNPNRKEAISLVEVTANLDEVIHSVEMKFGKLPKIIATSARPGPDRISYDQMKSIILSDPTTPYLIMFGTGWGMGPELLSRADYFLAPINGPTPYNHLSVRSACAIILDRILGS